MKRPLRLLGAAAGLSLAALTATSANAQTADEGLAGHIQAKLFVSVVTPQDKIRQLNDPNDILGPTVVSGARSDVSTNVVPTVAIEYFLSNNISVETICCVTAHHVDGAGTLAGAHLVSDAKIIPATFTLKLHMPVGPIKPYVGVGPTYFIFVGENSGSTAQSLGAASAHINDKVGLALQGGVDMALNPKMFLSVDAKKYFLTTTARWYAADGTEALNARVRLDPWVISGGIGFRF